MKYLTNGFAPGMLELPTLVQFNETTAEEFCQVAKDPSTINAIGHKGTSDLINQLCGSNITTNRIQIKANANDELYIVNVAVRLEEGKVLKKEELEQLLKDGKIKFVKAKVIDYKVISDLIRCKGVCDEKTYDSLVSELGRDVQ